MTTTTNTKQRLDVIFSNESFMDTAINAGSFEELYEAVTAVDSDITEDELGYYLVDVSNAVNGEYELTEEELEGVAGGIPLWKLVWKSCTWIYKAYKIGYWVGTKL